MLRLIFHPKVVIPMILIIRLLPRNIDFVRGSARAVPFKFIVERDTKLMEARAIATATYV